MTPTASPTPPTGGCVSASDSSEVDPATACNDGLDNDGDGWSDVADPDCATPVTTTGEVGYSDIQCNDGVDNDTIQGTDGDDPSCGSARDNSEYR